MKTILTFNILLFTFFSINAQTPVGKWKTIDDSSGKPRSIVEIYEVDGKLHGKITKLFREPGEDPDPICDDCKGEKHNQKVIGMEILWDLEKDGKEWNDGHIMDPENGKTYGCYITLVEPNKLKVRGFLGFSLLGRTQYWERAD